MEKCGHCGLPIEWWHPESHVNGYWRHVEGETRCDLKASPMSFVKKLVDGQMARRAENLKIEQDRILNDPRHD